MSYLRISWFPCKENPCSLFETLISFFLKNQTLPGGILIVTCLGTDICTELGRFECDFLSVVEYAPGTQNNVFIDDGVLGGRM